MLDHHPALELLADGDRIAGAAGIDRQRDRPWRIRASAVVLATGGCAFGERILGATGLTGDGYLMAAEAGATMSGMEFSAQYAFTPKPSALNKGLPFRWASFTREDGSRLAIEGKDRHVVVAEALFEGPVYAPYDKASPELRQWLRQGQPNCFLPLDRIGVDAFDRALAGDAALRGHRARCRRHPAGRRRLLDRRAGPLRRRRRGEPRAPDRRNHRRWRPEFIVGHRIRQLGGPGGGGVCRIRRRRRRPTPRAARTGRAEAGGRQPRRIRPAAAVAGVREEMLPIDRNFFRTEADLKRSLDRLDANWTELRHHAQGEGLAALRAREAAALTATSRWAYASAIARAESRGMHRRRDAPGRDAEFTCRIEARGLDRVAIVRRPIEPAGAAP